MLSAFTIPEATNLITSSTKYLQPLFESWWGIMFFIIGIALVPMIFAFIWGLAYEIFDRIHERLDPEYRLENLREEVRERIRQNAQIQADWELWKKSQK